MCAKLQGDEQLALLWTREDGADSTELRVGPVRKALLFHFFCVPAVFFAARGRTAFFAACSAMIVLKIIIKKSEEDEGKKPKAEVTKSDPHHESADEERIEKRRRQHFPIRQARRQRGKDTDTTSMTVYAR